MTATVQTDLALRKFDALPSREQDRIDTEFLRQSGLSLAGEMGRCETDADAIAFLRFFQSELLSFRREAVGV